MNKKIHLALVCAVLLISASCSSSNASRSSTPSYISMSVTDTMHHIRPNTTLEPSISEISLNMIPGETEGVQLVIPPDGTAHTNLRIRVSDLVTRAESHRIGRENTKIDLLAWVKADANSKLSIHDESSVADRLVGDVPGRLSPNADRPTVFLVQFDIPKFATPGIYRANLSLFEGLTEIARKRVVIKVHNVKTPTMSPLRVSTQWNFKMEEALGVTTLPEKTRKTMFDLLLSCHITPANFFGNHPDPSVSEFNKMVERGATVIPLAYFSTHSKTLANKNDFKSRLDVLQANYLKLKNLGIAHLAVALVGDEPKPSEYGLIRNIAEKIHNVAPEIKVWSASRPIPELMDTIDIWDMVTQHDTQRYAPHSFTREALQTIKDNDAEAWWFLSVEPLFPAMNVFLDSPLIDGRLLSWATWDEGIDGWEYFWISDWRGIDLTSIKNPNTKLYLDGSTPMWYEHELIIPNNGAGVLVYPGIDGNVHASMRLLSMRDGIEDAAIAYAITKEANRKSSNFGIEFDNPTSVQNFRDNLDTVKNRRREMIELLEALR